MMIECASLAEPEAARPSRKRPAPQLSAPFVGRDGELSVLLAAVASRAPRIWITGAPGVGKSDLVIQLVARCCDERRPYHWLVAHEPATPDALRAIASELGRAEVHSRPT